MLFDASVPVFATTAILHLARQLEVITSIMNWISPSTALQFKTSTGREIPCHPQVTQLAGTRGHDAVVTAS